MICRIWNFVAFIGIVSTSTDDSSLRLVQFVAENDILTEIGLIHVWICCSFSCLGTFWIVLDRFVLGENIGLCVRFSCYLTLHHARCFARIVLHVQPLRLVWDFYITYLLSEIIVDV